MSEIRQRLKKWREVPTKHERLGEFARRAERPARQVGAWRGFARRVSRRCTVGDMAPSCRERDGMTSTFRVAFGLASVADAARRIGFSSQRPNQTPEPTPTAGTSAAEQPLVPAAVVAHL